MIGEGCFWLKRTASEFDREWYMTGFQSAPIMENDITKSSGNVFEDIGFEGSDAENLRVRARLMAAIRICIFPHIHVLFHTLFYNHFSGVSTL